MNENKNSEGKMPGEISLSSIELGMDCRKYLQWYYAVDNDNVAFGDFKGRIIKIGRRGILFKWLYIDFMEMDGNYVTGKEGHIWVFDKRPFLKAKIKVNDCVSFTGKVYAYRRQDESIDFSLKDCEDIKKIDSYALPSDDDLQRQTLERIVCETCLYSEHCYGFCIASANWKNARIEAMLPGPKMVLDKEMEEFCKKKATEYRIRRGSDLAKLQSSLIKESYFYEEIPMKNEDAVDFLEKERAEIASRRNAMFDRIKQLPIGGIYELDKSSMKIGRQSHVLNVEGSYGSASGSGIKKIFQLEKGTYRVYDVFQQAQVVVLL